MKCTLFWVHKLRLLLLTFTVRVCFRTRSFLQAAVEFLATSAKQPFLRRGVCGFFFLLFFFWGGGGGGGGRWRERGM